MKRNFNKRLIPVLLIKDNGLYKGEKFKNFKYIGDPINTSQLFSSKKVDEIFLFDIEATKSEKPINFDLISRIAKECSMPITYGGGIDNIEKVKKIIHSGAEKVSINSAFFKNPKLITEASNIFGKQSISVSIDLKKSFFGKYNVYSKSGTKKESKDYLYYVKLAENLGAGEILINFINLDGKMEGTNIKLANYAASKIKIPLVVSGGIGSIEEINQYQNYEISAVAAGSLFVYANKKKSILINYPKND